MQIPEQHPAAPERTFLLQIRQKLDNASASQRKLAEAREGLLVQRVNVRDSAKVVRVQRNKTRDAEVAYMNLIRQSSNEPGKVSRLALEAAYAEVQEEHDKLGQLEEEYLQAERSLGGAEWTFMGKENIFYDFELQDLFLDDFPETLGFENVPSLPLPPPPPPPPPPLDTSLHLPADGMQSPITIKQQYEESLAKLSHLRKKFDLLRPEQSERLESRGSKYSRRPNSLDNSEFATKYSHLLDEIFQHDVKTQRLKQESMRDESLNILMDRRHSDPIHWIRQDTASQPGNVARARTETALTALLDNPVTPHRIQDWLLELLQNNVIERSMYTNILAEFGVSLDYELRDGPAACCWSFDSKGFASRLTQSLNTVTHAVSNRPDQDHPSCLAQISSDDVWVKPKSSGAPAAELSTTDMLTSSIAEAEPPESSTSETYASQNRRFDHENIGNLRVFDAAKQPRTNASVTFASQSEAELNPNSVQSQKSESITPSRHDSCLNLAAQDSTSNRMSTALQRSLHSDVMLDIEARGMLDLKASSASDTREVSCGPLMPKSRRSVIGEHIKPSIETAYAISPGNDISTRPSNPELTNTLRAGSVDNDQAAGGTGRTERAPRTFESISVNMFPATPSPVPSRPASERIVRHGKFMDWLPWRKRERSKSASNIFKTDYANSRFHNYTLTETQERFAQLEHTLRHV